MPPPGTPGSTRLCRRASRDPTVTGEAGYQRDLLPEVVLHVHTYRGPEPTGIARVEGVGTVTMEWLRTWLGPRASLTVKPVLDLEGQAPVDGYEI